MSKQTEFDRFAHDYRKIHDHNLRKTGYTSDYFAERKIREIVAHVPDRNQKLHILDLGCGDGLGTQFFRKYYPRADLQGLDISEQSILAAVKRNISGAQFSAYDGHRIPFKDEAFNIIMLAGVLHHVVAASRQHQIIRECHRVLKAAGTLFIFEHNPLNPLTRRLVNDCPFDENAKLINHIRIKKMLHQRNFKAQCHFITFLPAYLKRFVFLEKWIGWVPIGGQYVYTCSKKNDTHEAS
jgi:ubiquinone/menaquinone biosynthesis C-methylase UbiE